MTWKCISCGSANSTEVIRCGTCDSERFDSSGKVESIRVEGQDVVIRCSDVAKAHAVQEKLDAELL